MAWKVSFAPCDDSFVKYFYVYIKIIKNKLNYAKKIKLLVLCD